MKTVQLQFEGQNIGYYNSISAASYFTGINECTLRTWLRNPDMVNRLGVSIKFAPFQPELAKKIEIKEAKYIRLIMEDDVYDKITLGRWEGK